MNSGEFLVTGPGPMGSAVLTLQGNKLTGVEQLDKDCSLEEKKAEFKGCVVSVHFGSRMERPDHHAKTPRAHYLLNRQRELDPRFCRVSNYYKKTANLLSDSSETKWGYDGLLFVVLGRDLRVGINDLASVSKGDRGLAFQRATNAELSAWVHGYRPYYSPPGQQAVELKDRKVALSLASKYCEVAVSSDLFEKYNQLSLYTGFSREGEPNDAFKMQFEIKGLLDLVDRDVKRLLSIPEYPSQPLSPELHAELLDIPDVKGVGTICDVFQVHLRPGLSDQERESAIAEVYKITDRESLKMFCILENGVVISEQ